MHLILILSFARQPTSGPVFILFGQMVNNLVQVGDKNTLLDPFLVIYQGSIDYKCLHASKRKTEKQGCNSFFFITSFYKRCLLFSTESRPSFIMGSNLSHFAIYDVKNTSTEGPKNHPSFWTKVIVFIKQYEKQTHKIEWVGWVKGLIEKNHFKFLRKISIDTFQLMQCT